MSDHRVPLRRRALRRYPDPLSSRDPRVVDLLEQLSSLDPAPPPREPFRSELRAQLVAIAPRIVAEEAEAPDARGRHAAVVGRPSPHRVTDEEPELPSPARHRLPHSKRRISIPIARPLRVVATLMVAFILVLGGATWMSQNSLPGDALYGLKQASERAELALAGDDDARARDHLEFAGTRVDEARRLLGRNTSAGSGALADGRVSDRTARLISDTLHRADLETQAAARLLGDLAVSKSSGSPLSAITSWAPAQISRLTTLWKSMPMGSTVQDRTFDSREVVQRAAARADQLRGKANCGCLKGRGSDSLGPLPCVKCASKAPGKSGGGGKSGSARPSSGGRPVGSSTGSRANQPAGSSTAGRGGSSSSKGPLLPLPSLKVPSKKASVPQTSPSSCIDLLDVIHIGNCPTETP